MTTVILDAAESLIRQTPEILHRWERRVRSEVSASRDQEPLVLQNNLARLLAEVARALSPDGEPAALIGGLTLSEDHGGHRARVMEYTLAEVFVEYRILRKTVLEVLDQERPLRPDEREVITDALERAMQDAVSQFAQVHQDAEQARTVASDVVADALREHDQRKNDFLGLLAHELRTPLSAMTSAIYILEHMDLGDDRAVRQLQALDRQTRHLARLTDDILDITRIVQNKIELRLEPVDLRRVAQNAVDTSRTFIDARGQELTVTLPPEPVGMIGDPVRLEQVFTNLLNNAAKFTEPGGRISLLIVCEDEAAVVKVADSGIGVAPALLPQIFDMFAQADPALAHSSVGMGLAVVRRLVELHGGIVTAASPGPGQGTEFVVRFPRDPTPQG